jgi:hypothetical protein
MTIAPICCNGISRRSSTAVVDHVTRFLGAVEKFRFFDLKVYAFAKAEAFLRVYSDPTRAAKARTTFPCPKV